MVEHMGQSDDELIEKLNERDKGFLVRLGLRVGVAILALIWLFVAAPTGCVGDWVASGFESVTSE